MKQNNQRGTNRLIRIVLRMAVICTIGLFLLVVVAGIWFVRETMPEQVSGKTVTLDVHQGDTLKQVAAMLQAEGLIRNAFVFRVYSHFASDSGIKAGQYSFRTGMSLHGIVIELTAGQSSANNVIVTIPEGFTVVQIAQRLQQAGVCDELAFLDEEQHGLFHESFLRDIPHYTLVKYRYEGYLFPDTYDFLKNEGPHEVIDAMLRNFARNVNGSVIHDMSMRHMTLPQVITEASLIEKEAKVGFERPVIASVIDNRLAAKPPMKLQIDATVEYILGHQNIVTDADLRSENPYNTYRYLGLPPGPIANPGLASIVATLHPAKTNFYYYVVKNNGSGEHYFSQTYAQQLKNEAISQKALLSSKH